MLSPSLINTRLVFRIYAATLVILGLYGLNGGTVGQLGAQLQPATLVLQPTAASPFGAYVVPRLVGTTLLTAGLIALAFARLDAEARRRSLNRFAAAHVVFGVLFSGITVALLTPTLPAFVCWGPLAVGIVLSMFAVIEAQGRPRSAVSMDALRSQYEVQIREAARREERSRLARDLHDAVKQQLFAIQTAAATVEARLATDHIGAVLAAGTVRASAHEALVEMDALIDQLQAAPMENTGLVEALRRQCQALGFRTGAEVELTLGEMPASTALVPGTQEGLYRFAQEALANIARHARAKRVTVFLGKREGRLELTITDDGVGFDPAGETTGMGRQNMALRAQELGAEYVVTSVPGGGTTVRCVVPVSGVSLLRRARYALAWVACSGLLGFVMYTAGGVNDQGRPASDFGFEFLRVFGTAIGIGVILILLSGFIRAAVRFDVNFLRALSRR